MTEFFSGFAEARWPQPGDRDRVAQELAAWLAAAEEIDDPETRSRAKRLSGMKLVRNALAAVFGNSPYLADCALRQPGFLVDLLSAGPDEALRRLSAELSATHRASVSIADLMAGLRIAKRRAALTVALADIAALWPLERVTAALSDFAELALDLAARHLLREAASAGAFRLPHADDPARDSGLAIIGMGKLGARELNYSSDIDIIVLYDDETIETDSPEALRHHFVRLARGLVKIMQESTPEGYVLRTDLRLRPDPGSTPLAISMTAAEIYYESFGQNWERAAMIKARAVAGDIAAGQAFLSRLRPYVWRKHLDFAAIQDIHSIKRQINAHHGGARIELGEHNIKIGRGGIREIEFFVQTQQLIWGGRTPSLRKAATCDALAALAEAGRVRTDTAAELQESYRFLRQVEHRLQMVDDRQTHSLPSEGPRMDALAVFLGFKNGKEFGSEMLKHLRRVEGHYARLFEEAPTLSGPGNLVFTGAEDDPATLRTLAEMGYTDPKHVAGAIRGWHHGRVRAMRSVRARELLTELVPALLQALARTPQPDAALRKFDEFLARLPAGVQLFSLFHANPGLLDLVAEIMGGAPRLAETLARHTHLLDAVLSEGFLTALPDRASLDADLGRALEQARDFQDVLDIARRWNAERQFQIGVQLLRGAATPERAGAALADVAETVIAAMQPAVEADFARQHGQVKGGRLAVVAMGKLGGREMTITSDLDLIFIYAAEPNIEQSTGSRGLPVPLFYARLASRLINALTALTGEGRLYDVDMRLRPSGNKGPLATNLDGFLVYNRDSAWTWEIMALTRARPITGPPAFQAEIAAAIRDILTRPRDPPKLISDIAAMRALIAREHPSRDPWEVKHWRGGLIDVEFIAQYLQLRHGTERPQILATNTREALASAMAAGVLDEEAGDALIAAHRLWQAVQSLLRLCVEGPFDASNAPDALKRALARTAGASDFTALEARMLADASRVRLIFDRMIPSAEGGEAVKRA